MKILILCDHYPLSPRVEKIKTSLIKLYPNCSVKILVWNRSNVKVNEDYIYSINQNIGYGKKTKKMLGLFSFALNVRNIIKQYKPTYVHAIDFEMLILASLIINNKVKLIYEVYDIKYIANKFLNKLREVLERRIMSRRVWGIIYASPFFSEYYNKIGLYKTKFIYLNNKPLKEVMLSLNSIEAVTIKSYPIIIGFIGTIRHGEILKNLISCCKDNKRVHVLLAGDGPACNDLKEYVSQNKLDDSVTFTGRFKSNELKELYEKCDYIWSAYPYKNLNTRYAISNKFFESIIFRKKVIVSKYTMLSELVEKNGYGYSIDPYVINDIQELIITLLNMHNKEEFNYQEDKLYWEDEEVSLTKIYD